MRLPTAKNMEKAILSFKKAVEPIGCDPFKTPAGSFKKLIKVCAAAHNVNPTCLHYVLTGFNMRGIELRGNRVLAAIRDELLQGKDVHAVIAKYMPSTKAVIDESMLALPAFLE